MITRQLKSTLICILFLQGAAFAQDSTVMNLDGAVNYGIQHHSDIKAGEKNLEYEQWLTDAERSKFLPGVSASANYRYNTDLPVTILPGDAFGQPGQGPLEIKMGTRNAFQSGISLEQPIYDPVIRSDVDAQKIDEQLAGNQVELTKKNVALEIKRNYFKAVLYNELLQTSKESLRKYDTLAEVVKTRFDNGLTTKESLDETIKKRDNQQIEVEMNRLKYQNALKQLKLAMYYPDSTRLSISDTAVADLVSGNILPDQKTFAYKKVPEYRKLELQERLNRVQYNRVGRSYQPTLKGYGFIGADYYDETFSPFEHNNRWYTQSYVGLKLSVPIFEGFDAGRRRQALQKQNDMLTEQKQGLATELSSKQTILANDIRIAMKRAAQRENDYRLSTEKFQKEVSDLKNGLADYRDVLLADMDMRLKYQIWINALVSVLNSSLEYEKVTAVY